jgi:hypothetical protein
MRRMFLLASLIIGLVAFTTAFASIASADSTVPAISFETTQGYAIGDINGQQGWMKTNPAFDVKVANVSAFQSTYHFDDQALRLSDAVTSGSFGDQTFSPGLTQPAGEAAGLQHRFSSTFWIGTVLQTEQLGLHMSVSPDNGSGARMSYLRFEDHSDGVHVFFDDVQQSGPCSPAGCANFVETDIATLNRSRAHSIRFGITFKTGPGNDVVRIYIDGLLAKTGTTWEDYYRYDPEAAGSGNVVSPISKLLFRESGDAHPTHAGNGFLVDRVSLDSDNGS